MVRTGIPFYLPYTIKEAEGTDHVTGVVIAKVDEHNLILIGCVFWMAAYAISCVDVLVFRRRLPPDR